MLYCDTVTDAMIKGLGQQKHSVCYNILTNTMDVAFLYILLPKYGIRGYFASFLVTHVINFRLSIGRLLKITGERIPLRVPVLTLTAAVFALWVSGFLSAPLLRTGAFLTLLTCQLFLLKILSREDLIWLKGLICKKCPAAGGTFFLFPPAVRIAFPRRHTLCHGESQLISCRRMYSRNIILRRS